MDNVTIPRENVILAIKTLDKLVLQGLENQRLCLGVATMLEDALREADHGGA